MSELVTGDILISQKGGFKIQYVACDEAPTFRYNCINGTKVVFVSVVL